MGAGFGSIRKFQCGRILPRRCAFEQLEPRQLLAVDASAEPPTLSTGTTGGPTGEISGNVYASAQAECDDHTLDAAFAGARVQLLDELGNVVEEVATEPDGGYTFDDLLPGEYAVRQLPAQGLLEVTSVIGSGGGIAFGTNVVGEIFVQAGQTLQGYDFCSFVSMPEAAGPTDRPIVPHEQLPAIPSFLIPPATATPSVERGPQEQASTEPPVAASFVALNPPAAPRTAEIYGGSSGRISEGGEIRTWDDYLLDDLFARASLLELPDSASDSDSELNALFVEILDSDYVSIADGYTATSDEWCYGEPEFDEEACWQVGDLISATDAQPAAESPQIAKVAGRQRSKQAQ